MKIEIRSRYTGSVIFSGEDDSLRDFLGKNKTLRGANLAEANLARAKLTRANLVGVDLRGADLREVNVVGADLRGADVPIFCSWLVSHKVLNNDEKITINTIRLPDVEITIGCQSKTIQEWGIWFESSDEEFETKRGTFEFNQIKAMYLAYKAYLECLYK